jgi:hypothetical protein
MIDLALLDITLPQTPYMIHIVGSMDGYGDLYNHSSLYTQNGISGHIANQSRMDCLKVNKRWRGP